MTKWKPKCQRVVKTFYMKEDQVKAIELLAKGLSQSEVARAIDISRQKLSYWMKSEEFQQEIELKKAELPESKPLSTTPSKQQYKSSLEVLLERELGLLDEVEFNILPQVQDGSIRAGMLIVKVSERRSKLLGLDQKSINLLEAVNLLLRENVMSERQALIVNTGVSRLYDELRNVEDVN